MKLQWVDWSSAIMHTTSCQQDILTFAPEVLGVATSACQVRPPSANMAYPHSLGVM